MSYPQKLVNPLRPQAVFTLSNDGGLYTTPTGGTIGFEALRDYILTGTGTPSQSDIQAAQTALGVPVNGQLDDVTMLGIANMQGYFNLPTTGVPDAATLAKMRGLLSAGGSPKKKEDWTEAIIAAGIIAVALLMRD